MNPMHYSRKIGMAIKGPLSTRLADLGRGLKSRTAKENSNLGQVTEDETEDIEFQRAFVAWLAPEEESSLPALQYEHLPDGGEGWIRLVHLQPGKDWDPIETILEDSRLNTEYEALSYCWGDANICSPILCNKQRLDVTTNLKAALRRLRFPDRRRVLWIDAICINQEDIEERNQQVRIMGDIFRCARITVAWLGETVRGDELAFEMLKIIKESVPFVDERVYISEIMYQGFLVTVNGVAHPTAEETRCLLRVLESPWFERIWVVQEVALAKDVCVMRGDQVLDWHAFSEGVMMVATMTQISKKVACVAKLNETRKEVYSHTNAENLHLLYLLRNYRVFFSTDPRDKVFALFGLTKTNLDELKLIPDYHIDVQGLYIQLTTAIMRSGKNLDILSLDHGNTELARILPTWVPDWSCIDTNVDLIRTHDSKQFCAAGPLLTYSHIFGLDGTLIVSGHQITQVSIVGDELEGFHDIETLRNWDKIIMGQYSTHAKSSYVATGESVEIAYMRTLMADCEIGEREDNIQIMQEAQQNRQKAGVGILGKGLHRVLKTRNPRKRLLERNDVLYQLLTQPMFSRRICWTIDGQLGLLPRLAVTGDEIWLVKGSKVPLLLRESTRREGFELVGAAYIHGIMFGEAFEERKCKSVCII